jgi:hypothetical protein
MHPSGTIIVLAQHGWLSFVTPPHGVLLLISLCVRFVVVRATPLVIDKHCMSCAQRSVLRGNNNCLLDVSEDEIMALQSTSHNRLLVRLVNRFSNISNGWFRRVARCEE